MASEPWQEEEEDVLGCGLCIRTLHIQRIAFAYAVVGMVFLV
jgi:hypothetical protein